MRRLANAYLIAFAADAALSVLDELLRILLDSDALAVPRGALALGVSLATLPLYLGVIATPRLAPGVFLPAVLFCAWIALGALPVPLYVDGRTESLGLSLLQLAIALGMLLRVRALCGGRSWLFDPAAWSSRHWRLGYAVRMALANALGAPLLLLLYAGLSILSAADVLTAGFVQLAPDGIYTEEREYRRGEQRVYLIGMVHVGDRRFYEEVVAGLAEADTVVLVEGVTDDGDRLETELSYGSLAEAVGLAAQQEAVAVPEDAVDVIRADLDLSDFSPETVELLNRTAQVLAHDTLGEILRAYLELASDPLPRRSVERFWHELIERRDARAFDELELALESYSRAILPWGAAHMPGLEARVLAAGFERGEVRELRAVAF